MRFIGDDTLIKTEYMEFCAQKWLFNVNLKNISSHKEHTYQMTGIAQSIIISQFGLILCGLAIKQWQNAIKFKHTETKHISIDAKRDNGVLSFSKSN